MTPTPISRFLKKIHIFKDGCWIWIGSKDSFGYGALIIDKKRIRAHRFIYKYYHGDIPIELEIHHKCGNPSCVNLFHLEAVTHQENILRSNTVPAINSKKTHCDHGHPLSGSNLYITSKGARDCRSCWKRRRSKIMIQVKH